MLGAVVGLVLSMVVIVDVPSAASQEVDLCPAGMVAVSDLYCIGGDESPAEQAAAECPPGSVGPAGACYRQVAPNGCVEGESFGNLCEVFVGFPVNGPSSCPVSDVVLSDGDECYVLVERVGDECPDGTTADPDGVHCRRAVNPIVGPPSCEGNGSLVAGFCTRYERNPNPTCAAGAAIDAFGYCREPVSNGPEALICVPGGELVGSECVFTVATAQPCSYSQVVVGCEESRRCPDGFAPDDFGLRGCIRAEPASQAPTSCPNGSSGIAGACFIVVPRVAEVASAAASGLTGFECPTRSVEHPVTGACIKPVASAAGFYYCASPFGQLMGKACVLTADVAAPCSTAPTSTIACEGDSSCPAGYATDPLNADSCVRTESALVVNAGCGLGNLGTADACYRYVNERLIDAGVCPSGFAAFVGFCDVVGEYNETELRCPISSTVLEDGDECYVLVAPPDGDPANCPDFIPPDPVLPACRKPVTKIPTPIATSCDDNFVLIGSTCRRYFTAPSNGFACDGSIDDNGRCRISFSTPVGGALYCADPASTLVGSSCFGIAGPSFVPSRSDTALPVYEPADTDVAESDDEPAASGTGVGTTLAITGLESVPPLVLALGLLGAGASCGGAARVRRRRDDG